MHKILSDIIAYDRKDQMWSQKPTWNIYTDPQWLRDALSPKVTEPLSEVGLNPRLCVVFFTDGMDENTGFAHKDLAFYNDQWRSVPFAINFELNPSTTTSIVWYDTEDRDGYYDDTEENRLQKKYLLGVRYHHEYAKCSPMFLGLKPLESVTIKGNSFPLLVRTDVAHDVHTTTTSGRRCNISLRFSLGKKYSYDQAVHMLEPMILQAQ